MDKPLFKKLETFRKQKGLSILALCSQMGIYNNTYHRWKRSGKITEAYKRVISDFLSGKKNPQFSVANKEVTSIAPLGSDIAVIGIACYYPGASNIKELWENILARRVQFRRMLDQRLPLGEYYDQDAKAPDKTYLIKAAFLENFQFDWEKLRIPKKTVESTDIAHWLALDIALKTFEDAGYKLDKIPLQNTGVIVGNTLTGEQTRSQTLRLRWPYIQKVFNTTAVHRGMAMEERGHFAAEMEQIYKSAFYPITEDSLAGGLANTIAGRICNFLNLKGGGYIVDGACSSSLLAVATAADALKIGNMDLALAGGVDISLDPFELVGFAKVGALARDKMSVYDQSANGFLPGEGCGFVLLKRLKDALKDKNYIYAVIKGWGISSDGKGGIMEPSSNGQSYAIGRAYKNLEYKIGDTDFVEGHGTGTTKGDRVELEGIAAAIEQSTSKENKNTHKCGITSFKSIVGHTKAAAGVGGLIKAVLAVNQRVLPPTASCTNPNEVFKDKAKNLYPLIQGGVLSPKKIARAGISSAGFGGINCHVTVESHDQPKEAIKPQIDERALFVSKQQSEVFVFTSRTIIHLRKVIEKFKEDLRNISIAEMADLAALLNKKVKNRLPIKVAIVTDSPEHLYDALVLIEKNINEASIGEGQIHRIKATDTNTQIVLSNEFRKSRVGFLYPGQGSQRMNMTRVLVERFKWARDMLDLSKLQLYEHIYKATDQFSTREEQLEFEKQLSDTRITQPAVVASSLIWTEFLSKLDIEPECVAGHSLGEVTAFYKAGAFDKAILIKFAKLRGALMASNSRSRGSMVSLFCSKTKAEELIAKVSGNIVAANINSPTQVIASGGNKEIEKITQLAQKEEISTYRLNVSNAFHTSFMRPASEKIQSSKVLPDIFKPNSIKFYSGITASAMDGRINVKEYFSKQVISPVDFVGLVEAISKECDFLIEVGPGRVLTDLVKAINKGQGPLCLPVESTAQNDRDLNIVLAELFVRNVPVKWEELYKNRLIKVFVPASRKKFIENQCEHPLKIGNQILKSESLRVSAQVTEESQQKEEIIPGGLPEAVKGKDNIADLLIDLTHQITGFDKESITLNLRLLDDLNLDSIKAGELIGKAARMLGIAGQLDPSKFSNNTLGEIRNRLFELTQKKSAAQGGGESVFKRYHDKTWVRNFISVFKPEEITTKNVNQLKDLKNIVIVSEDSEDAFSDAIGQEFTKAKVQRINFGEKPKVGKDGSIDCLIAVLPKGEGNKEFNTDALKEIITRAHQVVDIATSSQLNKGSFVVLVGFGSGSFGENKDLKNIESCCMKSLVSTLYLERPELKVRILDFDRLSSENKVSSKIIDELQTYEPFSAVGYDAQLLRKVVYYENSQPASYSKRGIFWSKNDVVLVTGGAKGITAECALEFARSTKTRMILVGRSPVPTKKDEDNEILKNLERFEKEGLKAHYYQCDVTNQKDVIGLIGKIEGKFGKITGFIHGAGLNSLKRLKQSSVDEAFKESLPKVIGAVNVCKALSGDLKLIAAITSIIGLTGMEGSGWYGLANEVLNLYLHQFKNQNPKTEVVTIAYSIWDEVGMGTKLGTVNKLAEQGIGAIPIKEGVRRFRQLVENFPHDQQVIVAARIAGIDTWESSVLKSEGFRFIEKVEYFLPGVELIAQAHLNIKDDPYLLDHNWKGSLLFPLVFGLEVMAQAVARVLGVEKFDYLKIKNISLDRPISVPEETGTNIEIHAEVLEQNRKESLQEVKVEIYSQESTYIEPHFSAIFEINSKPVISKNSVLQKKPKKTIDLDIQTDIYGPILFQGKMFQCIEQIQDLSYDEKTQKGRCLLTSAYNKSTGEFLKHNKKFNNQILIGDPFFIDSMFQSMQLIIPQDICLPREIQEIELSLSSDTEYNKYLLYSNIKKIDADYYRGDAEVVKSKFLLTIKNCRLKILDTILNNPSANDLVDPITRDQKIIEDKLASLSKEFGFIPPVVKCLYDKRLIDSKKEIRHKIELPLIKSAMEELLKKDGKSAQAIKIKWLKSGKPVVEGKNLGGIGVSVSHAGSFLMVIAGYGDQGCDVETVKDRTLQEWVSILGVKKYALLKQLVNKGLTIDFAATTVWSASEVLEKINYRNSKSINLDVFNSEHILWDVEGSKSILTFLFYSTRGIKKISSLLINRSNRHFNNERNIKNSLIRQLGFDEDVFGVEIDYSGPQKQVVFSKSFPITFKTNQQLSRRVYFTNYFDWMGETREYSAFPVLDKLAQLVETGTWGVATNSVNLRILGELRGNDVVKVRLWMEEVKGLENSTFDLCFDWNKRVKGANFERVALGRQRLTWIKVIGHGQGKVEPLPNFIMDYMNSMRPRTGIVAPLETLNETLGKLSCGNEILFKRNSEMNKPLLLERSFETTLENSNLIGNIYFSNYGKWMGAVRDLYFYHLIPDYYKGIGEKGELLCLSCSIDHLSEAMPFDKVVVRMYLNKLYDCGADFDFEYYLLSGKKILRKLAFGKHSAIWIKRKPSGLVEPTKWPFLIDQIIEGK